MILPHLFPILFARKVHYQDQTQAIVECTFPHSPTLPMFIEAAAQSSAAFFDSDVPAEGLLIMAKNALLYIPFSSEKTYFILLKTLSAYKKEANEFSFEVFQDKTLSIKIASGSIIILSQ